MKNLKFTPLVRQVVAWLLLVLCLVSSFTTAVQANDSSTVTQPAADVGEVKNVLFNVELDHDVNNDREGCERTLTGTTNFTWPSSSFRDVVIIQDFSGSFANTIEDLGAYVKNLTQRFDFGLDVDGTSPKDRLMFVGFQGSEGYANFNTGGRLEHRSTGQGEGTVYGYYNNMMNYRVDNTPLFGNRTAVENYIDRRYKKEQTSGATPTIDGMRLAQSAYSQAISDNANYNKERYAVLDTSSGTVGTRTRETVYVLLTDGAANTAKWKNLPAATRKALADPTNRNPGVTNPAMPYTSGSSLVDRSYLWSDDRNLDGRIWYKENKTNWHRKESYEALLGGMEIISEELKEKGGVKAANGVDRLPATLVMTFYEDKNKLSSYDGSSYGPDWAACNRKYLVG